MAATERGQGGRGAGREAPQRVIGTWPTAGGRPYFANLKVMRVVLGCLRDSLLAARGRLLLYAFLEDRFWFVAEVPGDAAQAALEAGRSAAAARFRASDRKDLWLPRQELAAAEPDADALLARLQRLLRAAGVAEEPGDYPWAGGPLLAEAGGGQRGAR